MPLSRWVVPMLRPRLRRPRYADVTATLALLLALSGSAYAVATVHTGDIADGAVTTPKLHSESVTRAKLAANAVKSGNVADESLRLSDLKGIDETGSVSFTLAASSCGKLTFAVTGAVAGQSGMLSWTGTVPTHVVVGPLKVVNSTTVVGYACNLAGSQYSATDIGVRLITFD